MDRNSIIGLLLIGAVLLGYTYYMAPTEAEVQAYKKQQDSIAAVELDKIKEQQITNETIISNADTAIVGDSNDSLVLAENVSKYGIFANSAVGENEYYTIENELIKGVVSSKGGRLVSVELKDYKTFRGDPLILFDEDSSKFNASFYSNNKFINTENLLFDADGSSLEVSGADEKSLSMKLFADDRSKYVEYIYSIKGGSYVVDYQVNFVGLQDVVQENTSEIELNWSIKGLNNEKNIDTERNTSSIFYKYQDEEVDWLSETSADNGDFEAKMHWLSFKQQYFSAALICNEGFDKDKADMSVKPLNSSKYTKYYETNLMLPFSRGANSSEQMSFYFGPNHFQTLEDLNIDLEDQINLGWGIFGWMNEFVVIPVFNILDGFNWSYGIIILVLTLLIKMVLFPITYKNYLSSAKMRVLKPEIDELNEKNKDADAMKKQQETMALYKKAGVNPMAGCIPSLIQMPILYAMFRFFPASIELRQEGFLWADDLSTYDSIFDLPFSIPFYGDHISLFTLLMAVSLFFYTKVSGQASMGGGAQAQQMKIMMNMMPLMMLFFFNSYASGLSYYYFLANTITILQTLVVKKWFIDEAAIHAQIQENKKKPIKKSNFQKRLEEMQKAQQQQRRR